MSLRRGESGWTLAELPLLFAVVVCVVVAGILIGIGCWGSAACTKRAVTAADAAIGCGSGEVCTNEGTVCTRPWFGSNCTCQTMISEQGACKVACKKP